MFEELYMPEAYKRFQKNFPQIAESYDNLGSACHEYGPLDEKTRLLVKLAVTIGAQSQEAVEGYARRLKLAGAEFDEVCHAVLLTLTTLGFPATVRGLAWVEHGYGKDSEGETT